jgi:hypothetical protein
MALVKVPGIPAKLKPQRYVVELMGDTGAGRHLGSVQAFIDQGIPEKVVKSATRATQFPIQFETGGGEQGGNTTISLSCPEMKHQALLYLLKSCPLALSIGQVVEESKLPFIWVPGHLPFFVKSDTLKWSCPKDQRIYASRIYQNVPMFEFEIDIVPGLPASLTVKPKTNDSKDVDSPAIGEMTASSTKTSITDDDFDNKTLGDAARGLFTTANKKKADKPTTTTTTPSASSTDVVPTDGEPATNDSTSPDDDVTLVETALNTPEQAVSVEHLATHFPKNSHCKWCTRANLLATPAKRVKEKSDDADKLETSPMSHINGDHMIMGQRSEGSKGERACLL